MPLRDTPAADLQSHRDALAAEQARSLAATDNWSHVDKPKVHADWDALYQALAPLFDQHQPQSAEVQGLVAQHYAIVSRFYQPSRSAYIGMALFYAENADMKAFHQAYHPRMVELLGDAMAFYAQQLPG